MKDNNVNRRTRLGLMVAAEELGIAPMTYVSPSRYYVGVSSSRSYRRCQRKWGFQSSFKYGLQREGGENNIHFWFGSAIHFAMEDYFGYNKFGDPRRALKAYYNAHDAVDRPYGAEEHYELGIAMLDYFMEWYPKHNAISAVYKDLLMDNRRFKTAWFTHDVNRENWKLVEPSSPGAIPGTEISMLLGMPLYIAVDAVTGDIIKKMPHSMHNVYDDKGYPRSVGSAAKSGNIYYLDRPLTNTPQNNQPIRVMQIHFHGTVDKICVDNNGKLWLVDYKTAKSADTDKLDTDDQISRYLWAIEQVLQREVTGFIYLQLTKAAPKAPKILKNGALSTDKKQKTTHMLYRRAIIDIYGSVEKAPAAAIETLNTLVEKETPEGDDFIRWDIVTRTSKEKEAAFYTIMAEAEEMCSGKYLIPTPTRDCIWDCNFRSACLALDSNDENNWKEALSEFTPRTSERSEDVPGWESKIKWPEQPDYSIPTAEELRVNRDEFNIILPEIKEEN